MDDSQRIKGQFDHVDDFKLLLTKAEALTTSSREEEFVAELKEKFEKYGENMFLSDAQSRWLCDIAIRR